MSNNLPSQASPNNPLGALAPLAVMAYEWRTRQVRIGGTTWAGLWYLSQRAEVQELIAQHTQPLNATMARLLVRSGRLPGVREIKHLVALLPEDTTCCDSSTTDDIAADLDPEDAPAGIPIFEYGALDQAKLTDVRHATHLMRHLSDFHEPTVAAIRRRLLRTVADVDDPEQRHAVGAETIERFLKQPTRWRDVVETAIFRQTIRSLEAALGRRLRGPRRTNDELAELLDMGIEELRANDMYTTAQEISHTLKVRRDRLDAARVVLMYEEHQYLQLTGMVDGHSIRRHLPRGVHVIYSDQTHRREDRTAGLWLETSDDEHHVGPYHYATAIPQAYAAKQRRDVFRLPNEAALRRYVESDLA